MKTASETHGKHAVIFRGPYTSSKQPWWCDFLLSVLWWQEHGEESLLSRSSESLDACIRIHLCRKPRRSRSVTVEKVGDAGMKGAAMRDKGGRRDFDYA